MKRPVAVLLNRGGGSVAADEKPRPRFALDTYAESYSACSLIALEGGPLHVEQAGA